jgi:membrane-associated protease RseP (regulator of RpoE activity)
LKDTFEVTSPLAPELMDIVKQGFDVKESIEEKGLLLVKPRFGHDVSFDIVLKGLIHKGLYPLYRKEDGNLTLRIAGKKGKKRGIEPMFHGILLVATIFTVTVAGYIWFAAGNILNSILFTIGLMAILGGHELGHAVVARKNSVDATLPFFLPVPPFFIFGTLGAVIFMNSPIPDRRSLFDIGIAGPLTGFILSLPVLITGISLSGYAPFDPTQAGLSIAFGTPILFNVLADLILGFEPQGHILLAHPIAIAGWAGLFVTSLNLLPMGQLDGGHVIRAVFPKRFKKVYKTVFRLLFAMGAAGILAQIYNQKWLIELTWPGWIFWAVLVYFMTKLDHPGPLNDVTPLDRKRKIASILILLIFLVSFTPVPVMSL